MFKVHHTFEIRSFECRGCTVQLKVNYSYKIEKRKLRDAGTSWWFFTDLQFINTLHIYPTNAQMRKEWPLDTAESLAPSEEA